MTIRGYKMRVTTVDRTGKRKGAAALVAVPAATRHASSGFANIEAYVARVLASSASSAWVTISTSSGRSALSIGKHNGVCRISLTVDVLRSSAKEARIRAFFDGEGLSPSSDYLGKNAGVANATRLLDYPIPKDATTATALTIAVFREIYRLNEKSTLNMRFSEYEAS
jgi:hypothetical protein